VPQSIDPTLRDAVAAVQRRTRVGAAGDTLAMMADRLRSIASLAEGERVARALLDDADWIAAAFARSMACLQEEPSARHDALRTGITLFDTPAASVALRIIAPVPAATGTLPDRIMVNGQVRWIRYLRAGRARLWRWRADPVDAAWQAATAAPARPLSVLPLRDGAIVRIDGRRDAMLLADAVADIVAVSITLRHEAAPFPRQYDRVTGRLTRVVPPEGDAARPPSGDAPGIDRMSSGPAAYVHGQVLGDGMAEDARAALGRLHAIAHAPHPAPGTVPLVMPTRRG
jgi:hypothetical protein